MNHKSDNNLRFDDPVHEREWQAQEDAMRREYLHLDPADDDARSWRYRLMTRALRTAPPDDLPKDFAQRMSALARASERARAPAPGLEKVLTVVLMCALLLAAVTTAVTYGTSWWSSFEVLLSAPIHEQWLLALIGCLGLSWLLSAGSRLVTDAPSP